MAHRDRGARIVTSARTRCSRLSASSRRARRWIGHRGWRLLHYASFAAFALFLGHALTVGTDLKGLGGPVLAVLSAGPVLWLGLARIFLPRTAPRPRVPAPVVA